MLLAAIAALLASAGTAYLIGYAFVAPRGSFWRSKRGIWAIIVIGLTFVFLPPQLISMESMAAPMGAALTGGIGGLDTGALAWPSAIGKTPYTVTWLLTSLAGLLAGLRIWRAGSPQWRGGANLAYDTSSASRVSSLLPLADTLADALDTLARVRLTVRDADRAAGDVRDAGRRFASDLPASDGAVYALVARKLPADIAARVTGYLLEGAGRRGRSA